VRARSLRTERLDPVEPLPAERARVGGRQILDRPVGGRGAQHERAQRHGRAVASGTQVLAPVAEPYPVRSRRELDRPKRHELAAVAELVPLGADTPAVNGEIELAPERTLDPYAVPPRVRAREPRDVRAASSGRCKTSWYRRCERLLAREQIQLVTGDSRTHAGAQWSFSLTPATRD
jgi:hypothetical protein